LKGGNLGLHDGLDHCAMTQPREFRIHYRLGLRAWLTLIVALTVAVAILVAISIVAIGVFLFLLPIFVIASVLYYLFPRARSQRRAEGPIIIDGEFHVVEPDAIEKERLGDGRRPEQEETAADPP
jgi:uncharacterized protein (DUF58 family)